MSSSATVYRVTLDPDAPQAVLQPIGEAEVQEDGRTLAVHFRHAITLGPSDHIVIRKS